MPSRTRDHAGIKPLYYLLSDAGIFCASQYDQIMRHPWAANRPVSPDGLALYLRLGHIPAPYALLAQTHMLPAGAWLRATADGRIERGTYTDFPSYREPDLRGTEAYEAVEAAGGLKGKVDTTALNMARVLSDGEQLLVGLQPAAVPGAPPPPGASTAKINLNTASAAQLETLNGIGRFSSVDELLEVKGIGEATLSELRDLVTV